MSQGLTGPLRSICSLTFKAWAAFDFYSFFSPCYFYGIICDDKTLLFFSLISFGADLHIYSGNVP